MNGDFSRLPLDQLPSPCFVVDETAVERNLQILQAMAEASGAKILHALKAFSMWSLAPLTARYLHGTCASGVHEARLAANHYAGEIHVYSPAYTAAELHELAGIADHIVFNSCDQMQNLASVWQSACEQYPSLEMGLRVNPEHQEGEVAIYDPCTPGSRLGVPAGELERRLSDAHFRGLFEYVGGLHFHTLCEQDFPPLERTLAAFEEKFSRWIPQMRWINFGGGHHITRDDYQRDALVDCIRRFRERYACEVYLEPGEAIAIGCGVLVAEVRDVTHTDRAQAILDVSATCHMPDTLEMPYRADIHGAGMAGEKSHSYRLGGPSCLAGDVIGDYSFDEPLQVGQRLMFMDMAHYTMVKTTTFNGVPLPAIARWNPQSDRLEVVRNFGYKDFEQRLS